MAPTLSLLWCALLWGIPQASEGFAPPRYGIQRLSIKTTTATTTTTTKYPSVPQNPLRKNLPCCLRPDTLALQMYGGPPPPMLPPSGGGGGNNGGVKDALAGAATLLAIVAFFVSPLGGLFFAVVNTFLVASLLLPVVGWIVFSIWQSLYTFEGPCPKCGAPCRVEKESSSPSICLNCGTFIQANEDATGIQFFNQGGGIDEMMVNEDYTASIFDTLFGGGTARAPMTMSAEERQSQFRREQTIIDVEVEEEEKEKKKRTFW